MTVVYNTGEGTSLKVLDKAVNLTEVKGMNTMNIEQEMKKAFELAEEHWGEEKRVFSFSGHVLVPMLTNPKPTPKWKELNAMLTVMLNSEPEPEEIGKASLTYSVDENDVIHFYSTIIGLSEILEHVNGALAAKILNNSMEFEDGMNKARELVAWAERNGNNKGSVALRDAPDWLRGVLEQAITVVKLLNYGNYVAFLGSTFDLLRDGDKPDGEVLEFLSALAEGKIEVEQEVKGGGKLEA